MSYSKKKSMLVHCNESPGGQLPHSVGMHLLATARDAAASSRRCKENLVGDYSLAAVIAAADRDSLGDGAARMGWANCMGQYRASS